MLPGASIAAYLQTHVAEPLRVLSLHVPLQAFQGGEWVCSEGVAVVAGPCSHPLQLGMQWPAGSNHIKNPSDTGAPCTRHGMAACRLCMTSAGLQRCRTTQRHAAGTFSWCQQSHLWPARAVQVCTSCLPHQLGQQGLQQVKPRPEPNQTQPTQAQRSDRMAASPGLGRSAVVHKHVQGPLVVDDQLVQTREPRLVV